MTKSIKERKQTVYDFICSEFYVPMKVKELAIMLQVSKEDRSMLDMILDELLAEGKIECSKRGKYSKSENQLREGTFMATRQEFGFISVEGEEEDYFVSGRDVNGAFDGDTVSFRIIRAKSGKRKEAEIVSIVKRAITQVVGLYQKSPHFGFVLPENIKWNEDVFIPEGKDLSAEDGQKVLAKIRDFGDENHSPEGEIVEILGNPDDKGVDVLSIAKGYGLPMEFPEKVERQARSVASPVSESDIEWRKDLRDLMMVTIDGEDTKDFDDAVSVSFDGEYYQLGVHIADVSNYVQEGSALDKEALKRGTSVYLADRVIPMLPFELSNGICSLNAGEDRLALSCLMTIDQSGVIQAYEIAETVIRVSERMTYTSVNKIITEHDPEECEKYAPYLRMFEQMKELADILRARRKARGSIDFDLPESQLVLDENGKCIQVKEHERNAATKLIEDFMLAANETVAEDFFWQGVPFVYRCHEKPDPEKILTLQNLIADFGYGMKTSKKEIHPMELQKLLTKIIDTPEEALISRMMLRSMKRANYTPENKGHFGLAAQYYCHFTSPIRRYPDLQIHRIVKETLRGKMTGNRIMHYQKLLPEVTKNCSTLERRADEVERESDKMKKAEYMFSQIGQHFEGIVSGVTSWGIYVELPNTVEGMVRITGHGMEEDYHLGDKVRIVVIGADKENRTVDFEFEDTFDRI
jgi:ribonuclease R